jgi:hypothetical protein
MSLLAVGAQDQYIHMGPEMSYFKQLYRKHTNFSMESVRMSFTTKPVLEQSRASYTCRIARVGDLLQQVYFSFELPNIYSDDELRFRWVKNIANYMLYSYSVRIDTQLIDQRWGEWNDVWNELTLNQEKKYAYDRMCGNVEEFSNPKSLRPLVTVINNRMYYSYYPAATREEPSIRKRRFYMPLDFWFTKNPSLALPLVALQYQNVEVILEIRSIEEMYQVYDKASGLYMSPSEFRAQPHNRGKDVSIQRFLSFDGDSGATSIDLNANLECNFYFLDETERRTIAASNADFLVERVYRTEKGGVYNQNTIDLVIANPVKEVVWLMRRSDAIKYNEWGNFTAVYPENPNFPIMASAKMLWNGMERMEEKPAAYFQLLQPFQHHTSSPREGIYAYSFAIYPEKVQPSGSFNASMISKIQLFVTTEKYPNIPDEYEIVVYTVYYNIFRVMGGSGGMVFQS